MVASAGNSLRPSTGSHNPRPFLVDGPGPGVVIERPRTNTRPTATRANAERARHRHVTKCSAAALVRGLRAPTECSRWAFSSRPYRVSRRRGAIAGHAARIAPGANAARRLTSLRRQIALRSGSAVASCREDPQPIDAAENDWEPPSISRRESAPSSRAGRRTSRACRSVPSSLGTMAAASTQVRTWLDAMAPRVQLFRERS